MRLIAMLLLLLAAPAGAAELKIATWNLDWLTPRPAGDPALPRDVVPKSADDVVRLARYADLLAADVVALQEVDGPEIAARLFPPSRWSLHFTADRVVQRVGFAIRAGLTVERHDDQVALALGPDRRLRSGADITLALPGGRLRLLAVHLKSGCRQDRLTGAAREACGTLKAQQAALAGWIAERRREGAPFVIAGDFNRAMDGADPFLAGLAPAGSLARATEGAHSPCWGGGAFIDHIIAGGAARGWLVPGSLKVLVYRETDEAWQRRLSDHCPVSARFRLPD